MKKTVSCENCGKQTIVIDERRGNIVVRRGFTGKSGPQWQSGHTEYLTAKCSNCGSHHGEKKPESHESRVKRLLDAGYKPNNK